LWCNNLTHRHGSGGLLTAGTDGAASPTNAALQEKEAGKVVDVVADRRRAKALKVSVGASASMSGVPAFGSTKEFRGSTVTTIKFATNY
jgi:hypothetical protein